jgi:hypothetical protein
MTPREARRERRAAERKVKKAQLKRDKLAGIENGFVSQNPLRVPDAPLGFVSQAAPVSSLAKAPDVTQPTTRTLINRANALRSTGPRTQHGKLASSRNSLKHGLASGQLIVPGEDRAAFEALLHELLEEHDPVNATEALLVTEMAQSWWLSQRAIRLQNDCFSETGVDEKRLSLFLRYQTTHERAFHKALNTLIRLKKERSRGFVSQAGHATASPTQSPERSDGLHTGFVSQNRPSEVPFPCSNEVPPGPVPRPARRLDHPQSMCIA